MMDNKKTKYLITVMTVALFFVFVFVVVTKEIQKPETQPPLPKPLIPDYIEEGLSIVLLIKPGDFDFPSKAPLLALSPKPIAEEEIKNIASLLDFEGEPKIYKDIKEGNKYFWTNETSFFLVTPKTNTIKHGLNKLPDSVFDKQLSDEDLIKTSSDFLSGNSIVSKDEVKPTNIKYLKENPLSGGFQETTKDEAKVFQVCFTYKTSDYEILTLNPSTPLIFVQLLADGSVFNLQVIKLGGVTKTDGQYLLKNYEDVLNSLDEAVLVGLLNDYISIPDLTKDDIESIKVSKISLVYLLDNPLTKTLQPVYLLEGESLVSNSNANYAQLYLPAIKRP